MADLKLSITVLLTLTVLAIQHVHGQSEYKRVCYFTEWAQYRTGGYSFKPANVDPFLCTHIIYAFFFFDENMQLYAREWNADTLLADLVGLREDNPNLNILIAVGGYTFGSGPFSDMARLPSSRAAFISSLVTTLQRYNIQGVDLDWEYPGVTNLGGSSDDTANFVTLCKEIREEFDSYPGSYLLTAAVPAGYNTIYAGYSRESLQYMDFINVMAYDYNGNWNAFTGHNAPMFANFGQDQRLSVTETMKIYNEELSVPKSKLVLGMPIYGRTWTLSTSATAPLSTATAGPSYPHSLSPGIIYYFELCPLQPFTRIFDDRAQVPYTVLDTTWISYDDIGSLEIKADYVISEGFGGAMFWTMDFDDFNGDCGEGESPLINAVRRKLLDAQGTTTSTTTTTTTTTSPPTTTTTTPTTTTPTTTTTTTPTTATTTTTTPTTSTTTTPTTTSTSTTTTTTTTTPSTTTSTTTTTTTTPTITTTTRTSTATSTGTPTVSLSPEECRLKTDSDYANRRGVYGNAQDCSMYRFCVGRIMGRMFCIGYYRCSQGQLYDVIANACKPEAEVTCHCAVDPRG